MSYSVFVKSRDQSLAVSAARLVEAARQVPEVQSQLSQAGDILRLRANEVSLDIEMIDGDWCVLRCSEDALEQLARVADMADCDVEGGEGEVYRWGSGGLLLVSPPIENPRRALLVRYPWLPVVTLLSLIGFVFAIRVSLGI
jgi:hypothetical protein